MTEHENAALTHDTADGEELRDYVAILLRRWWVIVLSALLTGLGAWLWTRDTPTQYTAEVLLESDEQHRPSLLGMELGGRVAALRGSEALATHVEIMRSRAVLEPVVQLLNLRLVPSDAQILREEVFSDFEAMSPSTAGKFRLTQEGDTWVLYQANSGRAVGRAGRGEWVSGPGFRARLASGRVPEGPIEFRVLSLEEAVNRLRSDLDIRILPNTRLILVQYTSSNAILSARVLNVLTDAFQQQNTRREREDARQRREAVSAQLLAITDTVQTAQDVVSEYRQRSDAADLQFEQGRLMETLAELERELSRTRFEERVLESAIVLLDSPETREDGSRRIRSLGSDVVPGGGSLYERLVELYNERRQLTASRFGYRASNPRVEVIDSMIAATAEEMRAVAAQAMDMLQARKANTIQRIDELEARLRQLPVRTTEVARLEQRVGTVEKIRDLLAERYYEAKISEAVAASEVEVVDDAAIPLSPDPSSGRRTLILAVLFGVALGVLVTFVLHYADPRVPTPADARDTARLPLLVTLPHVGWSGTRAAAAEQELMEAARLLRTELLAFSPGARVFAVTATAPGDGATTVATHLGHALAGQPGTSVLLLDANLRRPELHHRYGLAPGPGLAEVMMGEAELEDALVQLDTDDPVLQRLRVLPGGDAQSAPADLIEGEAFDRLLEALRARFDRIVVDTAAFTAGADAAIVGRRVDSAVLVARVGATERRALSRAADYLPRLGVPLVGLVVNEGGGELRARLHFWRRAEQPGAALAAPIDARTGASEAGALDDGADKREPVSRSA